MPEMSYEDAIRYTFDRCGRGGGPNNSADADVFRAATSSGDWSQVASALADAIDRIFADAQAVGWSTDERENGGIEPNFTNGLERARDRLRAGANDLATVMGALSDVVHSLKALTLKSTGTVPTAYEAD